MKKNAVLTLLLAFGSFAFLNGQSDPLNQLYKQRDLTRIEQSLTTFGKSTLEKERAELSQRKISYKLEPNATLNIPIEQLAGAKAEERDNTSDLKQMYSGMTPTIEEARREFAAKQLNWNPYYLIDFSTIDWKKILMGAQNCYFNTGFLTPVKDQRSCGSCWAFAAAATWEHSYRKQINTAAIHDVSEEELVNCGKNCGGTDAGSCSGGWSDMALDHIKCYRVAREAAYPYTATNAACRSVAKSYGAYGWAQIGTNAAPPSNDMVKAALATYGALVTYVYVKNWGSYGTGVMDAYPDNDPAIGSWVNHAVTIVGYCDDRQAWIIKNSWGTTWGSYGGYAYIKYNHYNINKRVYAVCPRP